MNDIKLCMNKETVDGTYERDGRRIDRETGYAVGLAKGDGFTTFNVNEIMTKFSATRVNYPNAEYIGIWTRDNGEMVFDPVGIYENIEVALKVATRNRQDAIWDFKEGKEITLAKQNEKV